MPVLTVLGMPADMTKRLSKLRHDLQSSVADHLNLASLDEVSVFFPVDLDRSRLGKELICLVDGTFVKPERTPEVLKHTFVWIRNILFSFAVRYLSQCGKVEVIPSRYDQNIDGCYVWERGKK